MVLLTGKRLPSQIFAPIPECHHRTLFPVFRLLIFGLSGLPLLDAMTLEIRELVLELREYLWRRARRCVPSSNRRLTLGVDRQLPGCKERVEPRRVGGDQSISRFAHGAVWLVNLSSSHTLPVGWLSLAFVNANIESTASSAVNSY